MRNITSCRRIFSRWCSDRSANTRAASTMTASIRSIEAEERALAVTAEHAALADGQRILELGCGWGSLSLWMARHYPRGANHVGIEFALPARLHRRRRRGRGLVQSRCRHCGHERIRARRAGSIAWFPSRCSSTWRIGIRCCAACAIVSKPMDRMFMHVFSNPHASYRFAADDKDDWIAQHYFTGGIMPSRGLIRQFPDCFAVDAEWRWNGRHYQRTARHGWTISIAMPMRFSPS